MAARFGKLAWLWISLVVIAADQISKHWFVANLNMYEQIVLIPDLFSWTLAYNRGAAFSFLANEAGWQRWFFAVIALAVSVVLVVWLKRLKANETWLAIALALVLGGAIGNLYDRVVLGHVVDFILVHWKTEWYFPAFNIADSAITVGAVMLALDMFRGNKPANNAVTGAQSNE
ncbi:signal peptidase II [Denitrificimonas caeni]|uniref:signal peptidase II n=1 Tax=Denitrificimonas caeni TaxID=521720 RepID=UPI0019626CB2|nr:signal peptidase II [Denitrificimonas caeni]